MARYLLLIVIVCAASLAASAQVTFSEESVSPKFPVGIKIESSEHDLAGAFKKALTNEFARLADVQILDQGRFNLVVQIIKRPEADNAPDLFISAISTTERLCILEIESSGKVVSKGGCNEFLTSRVYIGREHELPDLARDIVEAFNGYVLQPLREIE